MSNNKKENMSIEEILTSFFDIKKSGNFDDFKSFFDSLNKNELQQLRSFGNDLYRNCNLSLQNK